MKILEYSTEIFYWMMPFSMVLTLLLYSDKKWAEFLKKFIRINDILKSKPSNRNYVKHILNFSLNVAFIYYIYLGKDILISDDCMMICKTWYVMYNIFEQVFWLYATIFVNEIILNLKDRYKALNQKLGEIVDISVENKFMHSDVDIITVNRIKKIKFLYKDIHDLVERTNVLFGWPIFCLMTFVLLGALDVLNFLVVGEYLQLIRIEIVELLGIIVSNLYLCRINT